MRRSDIVTVSTRSELTERDIGSEQAERRRKDTERGGIERKRRVATSPLAGKYKNKENFSLRPVDCSLKYPLNI